MANKLEPTVGIIEKSSTFFEKSTPEELKAYYETSRQQVIDGRRSNGGIEWDDGQLRAKEQFCKDYKRELNEKETRAKYTKGRSDRKAGRGYDNRSFKITKRTDTKNDDEDV